MNVFKTLFIALVIAQVATAQRRTPAATAAPISRQPTTSAPAGREPTVGGGRTVAPDLSFPQVVLASDQAGISGATTIPITILFDDCVGDFTESDISVSYSGDVEPTIRQFTPLASFPNQGWLFELDTLESGVEYCVQVPTGVAFLQVAGVTSTTANLASNVICATTISGVASGVVTGPADSSDAKITYTVDWNTDVTIGGGAKNIFASIMVTDTNANEVQTVGNLNAVNARQWTFTVSGTSNGLLSVRVDAGAALDIAGNTNTRSNTASTNLNFAQDCAFTTTWEAWGDCTCIGLRTRSTQIVITSEPTGTGAACPTVMFGYEIESEVCTAPVNCVGTDSTCFSSSEGDNVFHRCYIPLATYEDNGIPVPSCFCDVDCLNFGDCCSDFLSMCYAPPICGESMGSPSSWGVTALGCTGNGYIPAGQISASARTTCYCDAQCVSGNDCCSDYTTVCGTPSGAVTVDSSSCVGRCSNNRRQADAAAVCFCDAQCTISGDCCLDYWSVCSLPVTSCGSRCGIYAGQIAGELTGACSCDDSCFDLGDCCSDVNEQCYSCTGKCGEQLGQKKLNCFCDISCVTSNDCCPDFTPACNACGFQNDNVSMNRCTGSAATEGYCKCDSSCAGFGDCCPDIATFCP